MPLTRAQHDEIYEEHILWVILKQSADSLLRKAIKDQGHIDFMDVVLMDDDYINALAYVDDKTKQFVPLMNGLRGQIRLIKLLCGVLLFV